MRSIVQLDYTVMYISIYIALIIMVYFLYVMRQYLKGADPILMHRGMSYSHSESKLVSISEYA